MTADDVPMLGALKRRCFIDRAQRTEVLIAGSGRSGTTWLAELVNHRRDCRVLFEPFFAREVPAAAAFHRRQYVRPGDDRPDLAGAARAILGGEVRGPWIDAQTTARFAYHRRIAKEIRGNLFLPWLRTVMPDMPIILVVRHPCAVIASQVRMGWKAHVRDLPEQDALLADHLEPHRDLLAGLSDDDDDVIARSALLWCLETRVPLTMSSRDEIHVMFYEHLVREPEQELARLGTLVDDSELTTLAGDALSRPSALARPWSAVQRGDDPVESWTSQVQPREQRIVEQMLTRFGLDRVYPGPMPDPAAAWALMQPSQTADAEQTNPTPP
ncbi:MAG: sulfotransferase [Planctomycetota bacterium]